MLDSEDEQGIRDALEEEVDPWGHSGEFHAAETAARNVNDSTSSAAGSNSSGSVIA